MKYARFTKPLTIPLEQEVYDQIKEIAEQQRISMAEWLRELVAKTLNSSNATSKLTSLMFSPKV